MIFFGYHTSQKFHFHTKKALQSGQCQLFPWFMVFPPPVLKASLSHVQPCIVFKSIAFQGLHLSSTRLYKLEPCFSLWQEVDKSSYFQGCMRIKWGNICKVLRLYSKYWKTRDLLKKIRDTKGTFHAKMGTIKDRNGMDLTEAEDIKKRWQKCTKELYKKYLHDLDNHNGMITHLEPNIWECKVKWALGSITMN